MPHTKDEKARLLSTGKKDSNRTCRKKVRKWLRTGNPLVKYVCECLPRTRRSPRPEIDGNEEAVSPEIEHPDGRFAPDCWPVSRVHHRLGLSVVRKNCNSCPVPSEKPASSPPRRRGLDRICCKRTRKLPKLGILDQVHTLNAYLASVDPTVLRFS